MNKKFLSLVLALVMVLGTLTPVFAEEQASKEKIEKAAKTDPKAKVQWLQDEKIVTGRKLFKDGKEDTDLALDKNLQRDEITRLLVLGKGYENLANLVQGTMKPYVDVDNTNWANGVITVGSYHLKNKQGVPMLAGYPGHKFLPTRNVSYAELAKMLVVLVDNSLTPAMVAKAQWPSDWMIWAANKGILAGVEVKNTNDFVTRQAAFEMLYNALYLYDTAHHVDYGTKFGVVSGYANGELRLNQGDKAFTVKLNASTLYVNNSGFVGQNALQLWNGNSTLWIGSLVRVIADKDGNATHIIELGNPAVGAIGDQTSRWYGVADKVVQGFADFMFNSKKSNDVITVYHDSFIKSTVDNNNALKNFLALKDDARVNFVKNAIAGKAKVAVNLTSNTKYFVADPARNYLTEVDKTTAQKLVSKSAYTHELGEIANVYVGYDELAKGITGRETNEARIVVFNVVNSTYKDGTLVRVLTPSNSLYALNAENTKGEATVYNLNTYAGFMPGYDRANGRGNTNTAGYGGQFEKLNVLSLDLNKATKDVFGVKVVIDYLADPAFKVVDAEYDHGKLALLTLEGKNGVKLPGIRVNLDDTAIFLERQWTKDQLVGKYIQIAKENLGKDATGVFVKNFVIDSVISILDQEHNLATISRRYGQDELNVIAAIQINNKPESYHDLWRLRTDAVKFYVSADKWAEQSVPGSFEYYWISKEDAALVTKALELNQGRLSEVVFDARVIKTNIPGKEVELDIIGVRKVDRFGNVITMDDRDMVATTYTLDNYEKVLVSDLNNPTTLEKQEIETRFKKANANKEYNFDYKLEGGKLYVYVTSRNDHKDVKTTIYTPAKIWINELAKAAPNNLKPLIDFKVPSNKGDKVLDQRILAENAWYPTEEEIDKAEKALATLNGKQEGDIELRVHLVGHENAGKLVVADGMIWAMENGKADQGFKFTEIFTDKNPTND